MSALINGEATNYTVDYIEFGNLGQYMAVTFESAIYEKAGQFVSGQGNQVVSPFGFAMYKTGNFSVMMSNIADSMTNSLRMTQSNLTLYVAPHC